MATDKNEQIDCVIKSYRLNKEQKLLDKHIKKKDEIKQALKDKYGSDLYNPFNSGSIAKHAAINRKFDFDEIAPFKRDAFDTLKAMYEDVYDFLNDKYKTEATVKKQKVSIGLEFFTDKDGDIVKIDVVPGRELSQDQYDDDEYINLYVYDQFGNISAGSERLKTNPKAQISNIKDHTDKASLRHNIKLLKVWKVTNGKTVKSFFLELITIKAFDKKNISGDNWQQLKAVMEYIRDNVKTVSLPDPGNNNNDVADTLTDYEKSDLSDDMKYMIERIEENSDNIKTYFPINSKHPCEEEKKNVYSVNDEKASVPPPSKFV